MSKTIQECASMEAQKRREIRKQRILGNAEQRIATILAGPNGTESRKAPAVDGLDSAIASDDSRENSKCDSVEQHQMDLDSSKEDGKNISSFYETNGVGKNFDVTVDFVEPLYWDFMSRKRLLMMSVLALFLYVSVHFGLLEGVILPFAVCSLIYQLAFVLPKKLGQFPIHGYIVNALLMMGLSERRVLLIGSCIDVLWDFSIDLCVVILTFLTVHGTFIAFQQLTPTLFGSTTNEDGFRQQEELQQQKIPVPQ